MAKFVNSFALLDDEEGDDVEVLVDRIVKKVDDSLMHAQNETESSDFVHNDSGGRKGGRGSRDESRAYGNGWDEDVQGGDGHRRNYSRDSYGSRDASGDGRGHGRGQGCGKGFGGENGRRNVNEGAGKIQTVNDDAGWRDVSKSQGKGYDNHDRPFGDEQRSYSNGNRSYDGEVKGYGDQVQDYGQKPCRNGNLSYDNHDRPFGDEQRSYSNGNRSYDGEVKGYGDQVQDYGQKPYRNGNLSYGGERRGYKNQVQGNGQKPYRNGNQSYGGERRGYENQSQYNDAADGWRRYRNGRQSYDGERRGYEDQIQDNDSNSEQLSRKVDVNEDNHSRGEVRKYRNGNWNDGGERRDFVGNRGKGRQEYRKTGCGELKENDNADDGHDVKADHVNGSGGDAQMVLEASKAAEAVEQNTSEEVTGDIRDPKEETEEQKRKKELEQKKKEEEMKEAALMTLDQYEKLLLEKKQALSSQKTEVRRVSVDKEFEGMHLIEKRPDGSDDIWKSAKNKRKMKDGVKKQATVSSKTEDNREVTESEVDDSDTKLISEEEKLKKDGSLEKKEKEKGTKFVAVEVHDIFKPAFRRRSIGGGGQGRGARGDQGGGFNDWANNDGSRTNGDAAAHTPAATPARAPASVHARAPPHRRLRIPTDKDFPALGANPPAPVKRST